MTSPRFVPKSYAVDPKMFGSSELVQWKPVRSHSGADRDNLVAAQVHHLVALRLQAAIRRRGMTNDEAARAFGITESRLGRLLRGDVILRLEDIAWADRNFELGVLAILFAPRERRGT